MKHKLNLILLAVCLAIPFAASARDFQYTYEGQTLWYTVLDEDAKTCETKEGFVVTAGNNVSGVLVIPAFARDGETAYSVTSIGKEAFKGCSGLTSVTIPNSVTSIGDYAFEDCSGLTHIEIPNSVTSIGNRAFYNCPALTQLTIGNSITSIGEQAFYGCAGLTSVTIPNSVTSIGNYAFKGCSGLTSVTIGNSVPSIGIDTFYGCSALTSITIPNSVTSIGSSAFERCFGMTQLTIGNSVTSIGDRAFAVCSGLTSVTIPNSVTSIGDQAFYNCVNLTTLFFNAVNCTQCGSINGVYAYVVFPENLEKLYISDEVTNIPDLAFSFNNIKSVTIPNSVKSIGTYAFYGCSSLQSASIPSSVTSIGGGVFYNCTSLETVYYAANEPIGANSNLFSPTTYDIATLYVPEEAIEKCKQIDPWKNFNKIEAYDLDQDAINYQFNADGTATVIASAGEPYSGDIAIPSTVIHEGKTYIVTSIGSQAFFRCKYLTSVTVPNSVTAIGEYAFLNCTGLTSFTVGNSVTSIGSCAFAMCGITSVFIPNSVTSIGDYAFSSCSGLTSVYYDATEPIQADWECFSSYNNATLYVPEAAIEKCRQIDPWKNFYKIEAYDFTGVENIENDVIDSEMPCEIYNLNGIMVGDATEGLAPGIYILRKGASTSKIVIK